MDFTVDYEFFRIHAFWSKNISKLIEEITDQPGKSYATQHDIILRFINKRLFQGKGIFNTEFREKGKRYFDLKVPIQDSEKEFEIIELKVRTNQLKYLRAELNKREDIFSTSDYLYFCFLLQVVPKGEGKRLLDRTCIYYLVSITLSKETKLIPIEELVEKIKMGTKDLIEKLEEKSGLDSEKEELLGVENMIKVVDLERKLRMKEAELEEKEAELEEKDKEIARLKAQLDKK